VVPLRAGLPEATFKSEWPTTHGRPERPAPRRQSGGWWPAGFVVDLSNAFSGINSKLLFATILVVALVLIITYRSPWLWLVPLLVIGIADQAASAIVYLLASHAGLVVKARARDLARPRVRRRHRLRPAPYRPLSRGATGERGSSRRHAKGTARRLPAILASAATVR